MEIVKLSARVHQNLFCDIAVTLIDLNKQLLTAAWYFVCESLARGEGRMALLGGALSLQGFAKLLCCYSDKGKRLLIGRVTKRGNKVALLLCSTNVPRLVEN